MKNNVSHLCPEYLLNFDVTKSPLLNDVWKILEKINKCKDRELIYRKYQRDMILKRTPVFIENELSDTQELPKTYLTSQNNEAQTELEIFLDAIYYIDELKVKNLIGQDIIDAINRMPGGDYEEGDDIDYNCDYDMMPGDIKIRNIKAGFFEYITLIKKSTEDNTLAILGDFEIIQTIDGVDKQILRCSAFHSFREKLLECIQQEVTKGKIPDFRYRCYFEPFKSEIECLANGISDYLKDEKFYAGDFIDIIWKMYNQVRFFECARHYNRNWYSMARTDIGRTDGKRRQAKANPILTYYLERKETNIALSFRQAAMSFLKANPKAYNDVESATAALKAAVARAKKR